MHSKTFLNLFHIGITCVLLSFVSDIIDFFMV